MSDGRRTAQAVYLSHGGGPLPIMGDPGHRGMNEFLSALPAKLRRPKSIVVLSAHWESPAATLLGAARPAMLYDYYGFPRETYEISYPAPGNPDLAGKIADALSAGGIPARTDAERGFDHGLFIPLMMMYPDAGIPAIQLSLVAGLDPAKHVALGRALADSLGEDVLFVGSGFSFHNMSAFSFDGRSVPDRRNDAFQDWLIETCTGSLPEDEREKRLIEWERVPGARYCHPREEHLLPLHACAGLARSPAELVFDDYIAGKRAVAFLWR